jgi:hypothetical protein
MTQDSNLLRYPDGSWTLTFTHGQVIFPDDDSALTWFFQMFRKVGAAVIDAKEAETRAALEASRATS